MAEVITDELVLRFAGVFQGRESCYGVMGVDEDNGEKLWAKTEHETPGEEQFRQHLEGDGPGIGIVPIREDNTCSWGAVDWDHKGANVEALSQRVEDQELPLVVCRSKSGGAHLYLFLEDPVEAPLVQSKLETWADQLDLTNPDGRPVEIFPKQTYLDPSEDGNWINLPYYNAEDTRRPAFIAGQEAGLRAFLEEAESVRVSEDDLVASGPFYDGPPCLQRRHALGIGEGVRNVALFNIGIYLKLKYDDWKDRLREYNEDNVDPPVSTSEVSNLIEQLGEKDYAYTAPNEFRCECSSNGCVKQPYGVTAAKKAAGGVPHGGGFPALGDLRKIDMDPARWIVDVDGEDVVVDTQALDSPVYFRRAVMDQLGTHFPRIGHDTWNSVTRELFEDKTIIDPGDDVGYRGRFRTLLNEFLATSERSGGSFEDLVLSRMPVLKDGKIYFRSQDLVEYLHRDRGFREYKDPDIHMELQKLPTIGKQTLTVLGMTFNVYTLDAEKTMGQEFTDRVTSETEF